MYNENITQMGDGLNVKQTKSLVSKVYCEECKKWFLSDQDYLNHTESAHPEVCW